MTRTDQNLAGKKGGPTDWIRTETRDDDGISTARTTSPPPPTTTTLFVGDY